MLALILERKGELKRLGLDCARCKRDPKRRAYLGCGVAPTLRTGETWDPRAYIARAKRQGASIVPRALRGTYLPVDAGGIWELFEELWNACPAFWIRFYRGPETTLARHAWELYVASKTGLMSSMVDPGERLSPTFLELVQITLGAVGWLEEEERERERKERERNARNARRNSARMGRRR